MRIHSIWLSPLLTAALTAALSCASAAEPGGQEDRVDGGLSPSPPPIADGGALPADGGGGCPTSPCDLHEQCGCPQDSACDLEFLDFEENELSGELGCRGILIPGDGRSRCSSPSDCAAGYQCHEGQCRRYCRDDSVCGGRGGECLLRRAGSERTDDAMCTKSCDPDFEADHSEHCPNTFSCYLFVVGSDEDRRGVTDCRPTGPVAVDEDCSEDRCGEGLACIRFTDADGNESRRCQRRCRVDDQTCPGGDACQGFSDPTRVGNVEYGFCRSG